MTTTNDAAPAIDLGRLTAADMQIILERSEGTSAERGKLNLALLGRCVDGGLEAIPFPRLPAYLKALESAIEEVFNPKG